MASTYRLAALTILAMCVSCSSSLEPALAEVSLRLASFNIFLRDVRGESLGLYPPSDSRCRVDGFGPATQKFGG
jgi:hypothetical protein